MSFNLYSSNIANEDYEIAKSYGIIIGSGNNIKTIPDLSTNKKKVEAFINLLNIINPTKNELNEMILCIFAN